MKNLTYLQTICEKINYLRILTILILGISTLMTGFIMDNSVSLAAETHTLYGTLPTSFNSKNFYICSEAVEEPTGRPHGLYTKAKTSLESKSPLTHRKSLKNKVTLNNKKILTPIKKSKEKKPQSIHVTSDTMISEKKAGFVEFSGNARADDGDSIIKADSIKIFSYTAQEQKKRKKEKKQGNIKKIIASGNVRYISGNKKAFSDKAVYTTDTGVIVLTGKSPYVKMGNSFVKGKKITLFKKDAKVIVESGKKRRVEALFNSKDSIKQ